MEENTTNKNIENQNALDGGTYEILRNRLNNEAANLRERLGQLNESRKSVFGSIDTVLLASERVTTEHNCVPQDMMAVGDQFIFGYNVHIGLKSETVLSDVFSVYSYADHEFHQQSLGLIEDDVFKEDFKKLYTYYKNAHFVKFMLIGPNLFMVFRIGKDSNDVKTFKWLVKGDSLDYLGNRNDHEFVFPDQHEFRWTRANRDDFRDGKHPHVSIENRVFVETIKGNLTIKVEDNTDAGHGIYEEPVDNQDQKLEDAEILYVIIGNLIILKIRPYQEDHFRHIVFNAKLKEAKRVDRIADACVLLPDDQGILFPNGYYLQTGEYKLFDNGLDNMLFEKRINSPNGEDFLYVFYNKGEGLYLLLPYHLIEQEVENPIICHGYSIFDNGEMCYFKGGEEAKKHHGVQIWKTPYVGPDFPWHESHDSFLYKIGNKEIVRAMAECHELLTLLGKEDTYSDLYLDLIKVSTDITDSYHWLVKEEAFDVAEPLVAIRDAAKSAVDEFEKVVGIRQNTAKEVNQAFEISNQILSKSKRGGISNIDGFVELLSVLRHSRGEVISLKSLRYVDLDEVERHEALLGEASDQVSADCVRFLLREEALAPYQEKVNAQLQHVDEVAKVVEADEIETAINEIASQLDMLIDIVSNLKIKDATESARIIENISAIYAQFNQAKATLKKKRKELLGSEGKAEFNAQLKLVNQAVVNYLDVSNTPELCEEYLAKLMVQLEELEGKFSEFDEFIEVLTSKREEVYDAFESRKINLVETRNKRANKLLQSAERILKSIKTRLEKLKGAGEVNGYFASDLMISKVRDIVDELLSLGDNVKADDVQSKLKTAKEDALRQLKDKADLFIDGADIIQFGKHKFSVNTQPLELTVVQKEKDLHYHLVGTGFFEQINDEVIHSLEDVWDQTLASENKLVYRAEYLAYQIFQFGKKSIHDAEKANDSHSLSDLHNLTDDDLLKYVRVFMSTKLGEGYVKGVHDHDATLILQAILNVHFTAGLLKYQSRLRASSQLCWMQVEDSKREHFVALLKGAGTLLKVFPEAVGFQNVRKSLGNEAANFLAQHSLFDDLNANLIAEYLFLELAEDHGFVVDGKASELYDAFNKFLKKKKAVEKYRESIKCQKDDVSKFRLIRNWLRAFVLETKVSKDVQRYLEETAILLLHGKVPAQKVMNISLRREIADLKGDHAVIANGAYEFHYVDFVSRLSNYQTSTVPRVELFASKKKELTDEFADDVRLSEFKPRVLSSFVRNQLIDKTYLPLIGANLAKQIGVAGEMKRTDLMGLLLLISPPGYGKTTLMEYLANRLGVIFMKINGPAIGHSVTAIDPVEAPNAGAREELEKLNLAFEMGNNVMIYLDDIQHCNPEFLQKFISLCDAQRKIEGVYKGRSKTYDFRGKKVSVVMAGNPYTESGDKFRIPDMLANRADIYNLGDIIGDSAEVFKLSYLENCLTSNATLATLVQKSQKDVYTLIKVAETGDKDSLEFEANHTAGEVNDYIAVIKKLLEVRDTILTVNQEYISSAGQEDQYRREPAFKLQGSYRDMNKIAEKVVPVMNAKELQLLLMTHYESEAQTLTTGAEANLLKFKELIGTISKEENKRWIDIKNTYVKNEKLKGFGVNNQLGQVIEQIESVTKGLDGIRDALESK